MAETYLRSKSHIVGEKTMCAHLPPYLVKLSAWSLWWAIIESSIISFKIKAIRLWVHEPDIRYSAHADVFFGCPLISQQGKLDVLLYFICPVYPFPSTESYCIASYCNHNVYRQIIITGLLICLASFILLNIIHQVDKHVYSFWHIEASILATNRWYRLPVAGATSSFYESVDIN